MKKLIIILCLALLCTTGVSAQDIRTTLDPSFYHIFIKPGETNLFTLDFINSGDPQVYTFKLYQLGNPDLNGNLQPLQDKEPDVDIVITSPYIRFNEEFLSRTSETQKVPVSVTVPESLAEGEYYFAIAAQSVPPVPNQGSTSIQINGGNAALVIVTVSKNNTEVKKVETGLFRAITGFSIPWGGSTLHIVNTDTPIPVSLQIRNAGKFILIPQGEITLKNQANEVQSFGIVPVYLYPSSQRLLHIADFTKEKCLESFTAAECAQNYSFIIKKLPSGFYELTARTSYGNPDPIVYNREYFIVIPLAIVSVILLLLAGALGFVMYAWYKHIKMHHRVQTGHHKHISSKKIK